MDRDRFIGYAFVSADLMFEIDTDGTVLHGAGGFLDGSADTDSGWTLDTVILESAICDAVLRLPGAPIGTRIGPMPTTLIDGRSGILHAMRFNYSSVHCTVRLTETPPSSGLLSTEALMSTAEATGADFLAVAELAGFDRSDRDIGDLQHVLEAIAAAAESRQLRAGQVAPGRFAFIGRGPRDPADLEDAIRRAALEVDPESRPLAVAVAKRDSIRSIRILKSALDSFIDTGSLSTEQGVIDLGAAVSRKMKISQSFETTLRRRDYAYVFQPIVYLRGRSLHHYEMLARFPNAPRDVNLLSEAEESGLIIDFDSQTLGRVVELLQGLPKSVKIAVNISGASLSEAGFISGLKQFLTRHTDLHERLSLEVTESYRIRDIAGVAATLREVRALGFETCLDDFGAGAASFDYLRHFTVDYVKIDGSFVRRALTASADRAMLRAIITLARDLGIRTVAEMIETAEQLSLVSELGADLGQGFYFGKPLDHPIATWTARD